MGADGGFAAVGDHNIFDIVSGTGVGRGNDRILGGSAADIIVGDSDIGDASVITAGNHSLEGRSGNDMIFGDNTDTFITGAVEAAGGRDILNGGNGADTLQAGPANDFLNGGPGAPDDCDEEAGVDVAIACEIVNGVP